MLKPLDNIRKIIELIRPNLSVYMRFPVEGLVTAVDAGAYTCDVQPLNEEMSLLPRCRILSVWGTPSKRLVLLPAVNSKVMVGFEDGDHSKPYIQGFFPDQGTGEMSMILESEQARVKIEASGKITVESDAEVEIFCVNCKITTETDAEIDCQNATIAASTKVHLDSPAVELGASAAEAVIKGNTFQGLFNGHTHPGNLGYPTGTPLAPLTGAELSTVSKTE